METLKPRTPSNSSLPFLVLGLAVLAVVAIVYFAFVRQQKQQQKQPQKEQISTPSAKAVKTTTGWVNAPEGLNLRESPNSNANIIGNLPYLTELEIINTQGDWYFVQATTKGFVAKEFVNTSKPQGIIMKAFFDDASPINFLYPDIYTLTFKKTSDNTFEYSFTGNDSYGGFKIKTQDSQTSTALYASQNYPGITSSGCQVQFSILHDCKQLETPGGTVYILIYNTRIFDISYLKTEGGLLTDLANLIFPYFAAK